jgi:chemotaxis protein methyltransferase CheR
MLISDHLAGGESRDARILATDISHRMLEKARSAFYPNDSAGELKRTAYGKYLVAASRGGESGWQIAPAVRSRVYFAHLNLIQPWPMKGPFQVIFCRNVMIYFDRPTQQALVDRFWDILGPGGYLFVGHSEGLSAIRHRFRYVRPAVYQRTYS